MAVLENLPGLLSTSSIMLRLRRYRFIFSAGRDRLVETAMRPRVKRIRPIGRGRFVPPMFVHPKPWRGIFAHVRFERIPARLRDLLITPSRGFDFRMKHQSIATVDERLDV